MQQYSAIVNLLAQEILQLFFSALQGLFALLIANRLGFWKKIAFTGRKSPFLPTYDLLFLLALFFVLQLFILPIFWTLFIFLIKKIHLVQPIEVSKKLFFLLSLPLLLLIFLSALSKKDKESKEAVWGASNLPLYRNIAIGVATWFVAYPVTAFIGSLTKFLLTKIYADPGVLNQIAVSELKGMQGDSALSLVLSALWVVTIVPVLEELLFRGLLQGWLKNRFSVYKAIAITSIVFSFFHFSPLQGLSNIELLISLFTLSCFLGYLRERQDSLWASIALHSFFNGVSVAIIFLGD